MAQDIMHDMKDDTRGEYNSLAGGHHSLVTGFAGGDTTGFIDLYMGETMTIGEGFNSKEVENHFNRSDNRWMEFK